MERHNHILLYGGARKLLADTSPVEEIDEDMAETFKFPGGNDVVVVRKQDIVDCINFNIVDKEVALAIIQQCEVDATAFLRQGKWAGIPFIGSMRANQVRKLEKTKEQQELISAAYATTTPEQFVLFRRNLAHDNEKRIKAQRYYNFVLASSVSRNRELYKTMCKKYGEAYTRIHFFLNQSIVAVSNELDYELNGEDCNDR